MSVRRYDREVSQIDEEKNMTETCCNENPLIHVVEENLSRLRARNKDPVVEKSIPVVVSFVLLLVHPLEIQTEAKRVCLQKFQQLTVLPSVYNDCYVSTYGISHIFKKNTFLILQMTLYAFKGQLIQSLPFFCRSDQFEGKTILLEDLQELMEIHRYF